MQGEVERLQSVNRGEGEREYIFNMYDKLELRVGETTVRFDWPSKNGGRENQE
jgi:hypothetical protein